MLEPLPHPILRSDRRLVFAHRGGAALRPENTCLAFDHGVSLGADGLELDVHLSADGVPVVIHDFTLDRTTDAQGPVGRLTAEQLASVDAGHRFEAHGSFPYRGAGCGIPSLEQVLARYPHVPLIIELKGGDVRLADAVLSEVRSAGALGRVCVGGVSTTLLRRIRRAEPGVVTSAAREETRWALYRSWVGLAPRRPVYRAFQVPEVKQGHRVVSRRFITAAHRAGLPVQVWVVDRPVDMTRLLEWGADAMITDRPDLAVPLLAQWNAGELSRPDATLRGVVK